MKDVMKSYFYSISKTSIIRNIFIILVIGNTLFMMQELLWQDAFTVSETFVKIPSGIGFMMLAWSAFVVGWIGKDIEDKTMFLELATGKSRAQVLFGRFIISLIYSVIGSGIIYAAFFIIGSLIYGFGDSCTIESVIIKGLIIIPIIIYFDAMCLLITVIMKNRVTIGIMFYPALSTVIIPELAPNLKTDLLPFVSFVNVMNYTKYSVYKLTNINGINIYDSTIELMPALRTVVISLILGSAFVTLAYHFFKKIDF